MTTSVNIKSLLDLAEARWKKDRIICNKTGLSRATLWRIRTGRLGYHAETLGKLAKALNDD